MEATTETTIICQSINIRTVDGLVGVLAVVFGPWAAHPTCDDRGWHVTHAPTGLCVRQAHRDVDLTEYQARFIALRLSLTVPILCVTEWSGDREGDGMPVRLLLEHVEAIRRAVREATE